MQNNFNLKTDAFSWLERILTTFSYPQDTLLELVCCNNLILSDQKARVISQGILDDYSKDYSVDFAFLTGKMNEVASLIAKSEYTVHLYFSILLLNPLQKVYQQKSLPQSGWEGVCLDVKYKLLECLDVYKIHGVFVMRWFNRYFNATRFPMGRLQFEIIYLKKDYLIQGKRLKKGDPLINVHIPRSGERLDATSVYNSYKRATEFYKDLFPDGEFVFACESYLFHPSVQNLLKDGSNIKAFSSDYDILESRDEENYFEMWRVFDCYIDENNLDALPQNTSFRRSLVEYMKSGKPIGEGFGLFVYKPVQS